MAQESLDRLVAIAEEQLRWTRVSAIPNLKQTIEKTLTTTKHRQTYELCNGTRTLRDIANGGNVSLGTASGWTTSWRNAGLLYDTPKGVQRIVSLRDLDIPVKVSGKST